MHGPTNSKFDSSADRKDKSEELHGENYVCICAVVSNTVLHSFFLVGIIQLILHAIVILQLLLSDGQGGEALGGGGGRALDREVY